MWRSLLCTVLFWLQMDMVSDTWTTLFEDTEDVQNDLLEILLGPNVDAV